MAAWNAGLSSVIASPLAPKSRTSNSQPYINQLPFPTQETQELGGQRTLKRDPPITSTYPYSVQRYFLIQKTRLQHMGSLWNCWSFFRSRVRGIGSGR